jgi:plasmid stabilization system protein ParE
MAQHHSPHRAAKWYVGLFDTIESLRALPHRCALASESDAFGEPIRQLFYGKRRGIYRVLFVVREESVQILRIVHGARQALTHEELGL